MATEPQRQNPFQSATRGEASQSGFGAPSQTPVVPENPKHKLIWTVVGGLVGIIFPGLFFNFVLLIFKLAGAFYLISLVISIVIGAVIARKLYSRRQRRKGTWK